MLMRSPGWWVIKSSISTFSFCSRWGERRGNQRDGWYLCIFGEMKPQSLMASVLLLYTYLSVISLNYTAVDMRHFLLCFVVPVGQLLSYWTSMRWNIIQRQQISQIAALHSLLLSYFSFSCFLFSIIRLHFHSVMFKSACLRLLL